jgi:hypothetical protein
MKLLKPTTFIVAALVALVFQPLFAAADIGQPAPDFTLTDLDGHSHSLSDFKGKTVVLEWNNPDCPIVKKHYDSDNLPRLQREATAEGVIWLIINSGAPGMEGGDYTPADLKSYLKDHNAAANAYFKDSTGKVGHLYGATATPHMFVINPAGTLVYKGAIDSIPSGRQSDIVNATNYVRAALADLKEGKPVEKKATQAYGCSVKYGSAK